MYIIYNNRIVLAGMYVTWNLLYNGFFSQSERGKKSSVSHYRWRDGLNFELRTARYSMAVHCDVLHFEFGCSVFLFRNSNTCALNNGNDNNYNRVKVAVVRSPIFSFTFYFKLHNVASRFVLEALWRNQKSYSFAFSP